MFLFIEGFIIGFSIASQLGPLAVLCIRRTLSNGFKNGVSTGLGIALGDAVYGSIAIFSVTSVTTFLVSQRTALQLLGGFFLIYLGARTLRLNPTTSKLEARTKNNNVLQCCSTAFLLTLTNPMTIVSFAAIFAGAGVVPSNASTFTALFFVLGVFGGSLIQKTLLSAFVNFFRDKFTYKVIKILNYVAGLAIIFWGISRLATAL